MDEPEKIEIVDHVVSAEDLALNPELVEEGVKEGDVIGLPMSDRPLTDEDKAEIKAQHPNLEV